MDTCATLKILNEGSRQQDEIFCIGPFWIVADSVASILSGKFKIIGEKIRIDYNRNPLDERSKNSRTHINIWKNKFKKEKEYENLDYNYYPRGRVEFYEGITYIHINSICNTPKVIDAIIKFYDIKDTAKIQVEENDITQGSHYGFQLK